MEAVVLLLVEKIGIALGDEALKTVTSIFAKEVSLLAGVRGSMERISREFVVMKAFLSQADAQRDKNNTLDVWLEQVQKVAFHVEDIIDEYSYIIGEQGISGFRASLRRNIHKSRNLLAWHNIAAQLTQIEADVQQLADMRDRWNINMTGGMNYISERALHRADSSYSINDDEIVGVGKERERIVEWLTEGRLDRSIISILGMGGLGKTTLVTNVYRSQMIQKHFNHHAWVSVSQTYTVDDLLRRILIDFYGRKTAASHGVDTMDRRSLVETLRSFLQEKKYLVILDDVWSADAWFGVDDALPDRKNGSRIVITTRIRSVALLASESHVLELQSLQQNEAWDLFCKKAFRKEEDRKCPQTLQPLAENIVEKCQGLPLAIVAIGSLLSLKEANELEWRKFHDHLTWELTRNSYPTVRQTLNLSYIYLPDYLKSCFLHCSIFPEDYLIKRKRLIRLWVAEGFAEGNGVKSAEEIAEEYLNELIHRSMLQIGDRDDIGRVRGCRMHDLVRELNVSTSRTKKFGVLYDDKEVASQCNEARRMSVHKSSSDLQSVTGFSKLRSLIVFDSSMSPSLLKSMISQFRMLRILDLQDIPIEILPEEVTTLFNLHYMGLRNTKVKELPKYLGRLRNLQTLDLAGCNVQKLPRGMTELTKLRNLIIEKIHDTTAKIFHDISGVQAPKGIWNLRGLQTLQSIEAKEDLVQQIRNLTQLRSLKITKVRHSHCTELCTSITRMRFLVKLGIVACDEAETLVLEDLHPPPNNLEKLSLKGRLDTGVIQSPSFCALGRNLKCLYLGWSGMTEDPLPSLSVMSNLVLLCLDRAYEGEKLSLQRGWFPKLKTLSLAYMEELNKLEIQKGSMQNLVRLELICLKVMMVPRRIEFLVSLQELDLLDMPRRFINELRETNKSKIQHISNITHVYQSDGEWFSESLSMKGHVYQSEGEWLNESFPMKGHVYQSEAEWLNEKGHVYQTEGEWFNESLKVKESCSMKAFP